jgi:hypothetical protein
METINIQIRGINELNSYFVNLPTKVSKDLMRVSKEFCTFVQKSMKLRAPRLTGDIAGSIKVEQGKESVSIIIDSPYAYFQIMGFRPHMIYPNMTNRNGIKLKDLGFDHPVMAREHKDFLTPSIEMGLTHLPNWLNSSLNKSLK